MMNTGSAYYTKRQRAKSLFPAHRSKYNTARVNQPLLDGTVGGEIAVEIESRVSKQVRGALLDLICHPYPKKLLVLLPVHMNNPQITAQQCRNILSWFCQDGSFRVLVLKGSGSNPQLLEDAAALAAALADWSGPGEP